MSTLSHSQTTTAVTSSSSLPKVSTVYVALWKDHLSGDVLVLGVYDTLAGANAEVRRCGYDQLSDGLTYRDPDSEAGGVAAELLRWDTADGVACWVEEHHLNLGRAEKSA